MVLSKKYSATSLNYRFSSNSKVNYCLVWAMIKMKFLDIIEIDKIINIYLIIILVNASNK